MKKTLDRSRTIALRSKTGRERERSVGLKSPDAWEAHSENHAMPDFQKLPDPFLYDTHALISDLDSVRELILRIPIHNNTVLPANAAIAAVWDLRERLRELAALQAARQRDWAKTHAPSAPKKARKVAAIHGA